MNKNQIFKDVQKWVFDNHQHYLFDGNNFKAYFGDRKNEPIVFSLDFVKWFREYLEVDESVNWYGEERKATIWIKLSNWFHYTFRVCSYCHRRKADWLYGPATDDGKEYVACDKCVPRGCVVCNAEPVDGDYDNKDPNNWVEETDEQGRKYPCCEWWGW